MANINTFSPYGFPIVYHPGDHCIYVDDPTQEVPPYQYKLMNARNWARMTNSKGLGSDMAGGANQDDPLELSDIFYNNGVPAYDFEDIAKDNLQRLHEVKSMPNTKEARQAAGAVITSLDFTDFQNTVIVGENLEAQIVKTGVLTGLFEEVSLPNLSGKWASLDSDVRWHRNLMEGKSPEPSGGTGTVTTVTVPKHGGAVAITQRAQDVINGDNPFSRLVAILQRKRLEDENQMTATEIETNTSNSLSGVDFGVRSGTPPASTTNPLDTIITIVNTFEALKARWNLFVSKGIAYPEFVANDVVKGTGQPLPTTGVINEQVSPFPLATGVTWARDNAISSATAGWALNDSAIKTFRGPTRTYTVTNPDAETTKYVTKSHFYVKTMDTTLVYRITGITA